MFREMFRDWKQIKYSESLAEFKKPFPSGYDARLVPLSLARESDRASWALGFGLREKLAVYLLRLLK